MSAADALAGLDVAAAWPGAPRTIDADDLLAERVLAGDQRAAARLRAAVYAPLAAAPSPLLATIEAYLATGGALEPTARNLFVHPNTVRYRLHRIADLTGRDPWEPARSAGPADRRHPGPTCRNRSRGCHPLVNPALVVRDFLQNIATDLVPSDTTASPHDRVWLSECWPSSLPDRDPRSPEC